MGTILQELESHGNCIMLPCENIAKEVASARASNMVLLGAATPMLGLTTDDIKQSIRAVFESKGEKIINDNLAAFNAGLAHQF